MVLGPLSSYHQTLSLHILSLSCGTTISFCRQTAIILSGGETGLCCREVAVMFSNAHERIFFCAGISLNKTHMKVHAEMHLEVMI